MSQIMTDLFTHLSPSTLFSSFHQSVFLRQEQKVEENNQQQHNHIYAQLT